MRTILATILAGMLALSVPGSAEEKRTADIFAMDTHISMTAYGKNAADALEEAKELLKGCEQLWSVTIEESEIALAQKHGIKAVSLGRRILRTETAPLTALSVIMYEYDWN